MKEIYNIVELFSGIGSQARALKNIGININVQATCEWDMHAFIAYDAMHESYENLPEVEKMTKEQILEILKQYTLSNNGKEAMNYATLHSYILQDWIRTVAVVFTTANIATRNLCSNSEDCGNPMIRLLRISVKLKEKLKR